MALSGQGVIDNYNMMYDLKHHRGYYMTGGHKLVTEMQRFQKVRDARALLYQLKRAKYVKAKKIGDRIIVNLTATGLATTLADSLRQSAKSQKGDTVVIFDIPETQRTARLQLRQLLKNGGFTKLQQSVWFSRADNYDLLVKFIKDMKLKPWVNVFRATDFWQRPNRHFFK